LPPTNDWIFKLLFGDERNKSMLIDLLKSFVDLPEEEYDLTFTDPYLKPEFEEDKMGILDVRVKTASGQIINIGITGESGETHRQTPVVLQVQDDCGTGREE